MRPLMGFENLTIIFVFLKNTKTNFVQIFRFVFKFKIAVQHPLRPGITLTQKTDSHPVRNTDQEPQYGFELHHIQAVSQPAPF